MASDVDMLFRGFSEQDYRTFLALGEPVTFEIDEVVLTAGRSEWDMYVVREGEVSIWLGNVHLANLGIGQTIETSAILVPKIQRSAVRGNTRGVLLRIPREAIMGFFESRPERLFQQFSVNLFKVSIEVLKHRNRQIAEIQNRLLTDRASYLKRRFKLLIVEDEPDIRDALAQFFGDRYDIAMAQDGLEAVARALSERPDLILLDLRLPKLDGFRVCERIKGHPETHHVPIVMVTALIETPDKVRGIKYGADEYLNKPVDLQVLANVVSRLLAKVYG